MYPSNVPQMPTSVAEAAQVPTWVVNVRQVTEDNLSLTEQLEMRLGAVSRPMECKPPSEQPAPKVVLVPMADELQTVATLQAGINARLRSMLARLEV